MTGNTVARWFLLLGLAPGCELQCTDWYGLLMLGVWLTTCVLIRKVRQSQRIQAEQREDICSGLISLGMVWFRSPHSFISPAVSVLPVQFCLLAQIWLSFFDFHASTTSRLITLTLLKWFCFECDV